MKETLASAYPEIASEWDITKNEGLSPHIISPRKHIKIWWKCSKCNKGWNADLGSRTGKNKSGCPYCSGRLATETDNLEAIFPEIAKEWDYEKNHPLLPSMVKPKAGKNVWWKCLKGHSYESVIGNRANGSGCPACVGRIISLETSLEYLNPELSKQWHPVKNKNLLPSQVARGSSKRVWWICVEGHEWQTSVSQRDKSSSGCPYCAGQKATNDNSLVKTHPFLLEEWNYAKNKGFDPNLFKAGSARKVWWKCIKGHEWETAISQRKMGRGCPACSGLIASEDNNLLKSFPDIANEWDSEKNIDLTPITITPFSGRKVWWKCTRGHSWVASVGARTGVNSSGCPHCSGASTSSLEIRIYCELRTIFPDLEWRKKYFGKEIDLFLDQFKIGVEVDGSYWHRDKVARDIQKNNALSDQGIKIIRLREAPLTKISSWDILHSKRKTHFEIVADLLKFLKSEIHDLGTSNRINDYLEQKKLVAEKEYLKLVANLPAPPFEDSLAQTNPEIASEWDWDANSPLTPEMFSKGSNRKVYWVCSKGHQWKSSIGGRTASVNSRCPYCSRSKLSPEFSLAQLNPELSQTWDPILNSPLTPETVGVGMHKKAWWICPQCNQSFNSWISYKAKSNALLCKICSSHHKSQNIRSSIANKRGSLAVSYPDLLVEWDYQKNIDLSPENISSGSGEKVWWHCRKCEFSWESVIQTRTKNAVGCPNCAKEERVKTASKSNIALKGSLRDNLPYTASLWHPTLNEKLTPSDVTARSGLKVWWLCPHCNQSFERQPDGLRRCPLCKGKMYA